MLIFQPDSILQKGSWSEKVLTFSELLESPAPLYEEPLAERMAALQRIAETLRQPPGDLSEAAQLQLDFWQHFMPRKISEQVFPVRTGEGDTCLFELTINERGLFFKDLARAQEPYMAAVDEQLFSEFWFYGPRNPIPDLNLRRQLIGILQQAFSNPRCRAAQAPFELFEYPDQAPVGLSWEEGNHVRKDYLTVHRFGIEMGHTTWRDGPSGPGYLSFERFLNLPSDELRYITPEMRVKIEDYLGRISRHSPPRPLPAEPQEPSPREKLDRTELLLQDPGSSEGAELLLSLLEYEAESDYWRNYVFNRCGKLRDNRQVRAFVADCLRGDNEVWFNKSRDVLMHWGFNSGDPVLTDRTVLNALNWEDASASDPDFRAALEKVLKIIGP